mgnify:FL=1
MSYSRERDSILKVQLNITEYSSSNLIPIISLKAFIIGLVIAFGILLYFVEYHKVVLKTQQTQAIAEIKASDTEIINQLNEEVAKGIITPEQRDAKLKQLYPNGLPDLSKSTTQGSDNILGQITGAIPALVGLAVLGAVISILPRRRD